jgi:hypothetical protein
MTLTSIRRVMLLACAVAALSLAVPALADAATTASNNPVVTDGTAVSGEVGTLTEQCSENVIIEVRGAHRLPADNGTTYDCSHLTPTATITWGDGSGATSATLVAETPQPVEQQSRHASAFPAANGPPVVGDTPCNQQSQSQYSTCTFEVTASANPHKYNKPSTGYSAHWDWSDSDTNANGTQPFTVTVQNGAITFSGVHIARNGNSASLDGTFSYPNTYPDNCDFTVSIDWGDGTTTTGTVTDQQHVAPINCVGEEDVRRGNARAAAAQSGETWYLGGGHTYASTDAPSQDVSISVTYDNAIANNGPNPATAQQTGIPAHPSVATTDGASSINQTGATLNGFVDPQESTVSDCHFEYGPTTAYGSTAPCTPASFSDPQAVSAAISGLSPGTTYHYRVNATTDVSTSEGNDQSFTTETPPPPGAPSVSTGGTSNITETGVSLSGTVNTEGGTLSDCHFEYGPTTTYGSSAPCQQSGISGSDVTVSTTLSGLTGGAAYHYRLVASNPGSPVSDGADGTFTTLPDCQVKATFGFTQAIGCFVKTGSVYASTPGTPVDINGLTLTPGGGGSVTVDTGAGTIKGTGGIEITAANGLNTPIEVYSGLVDWKPAPVNPRQVGNDTVTTLSIPSDSNGEAAHLDGLASDGDLQLAFSPSKGGVITGNAWLPLPVWAQQAIGVTGTLQFTTRAGTGDYGATGCRRRRRHRDDPEGHLEHPRPGRRQEPEGHLRPRHRQLVRERHRRDPVPGHDRHRRQPGDLPRPVPVLRGQLDGQHPDRLVARAHAAVVPVRREPDHVRRLGGGVVRTAGGWEVGGVGHRRIRLPGGGQ